MIKKLRRKFILVNMGIVFLVLLIVFVSLYWFTSNSLQNESYIALYHTIEQTDDIQEEKPEIGVKPPGGPFGEQRDVRVSLMPTFYVVLNEAGDIVKTSQEKVSISEDILAQAIEEVLAADDSKGTLNSLNLRYLRQENMQVTKIAFIDRTEENTSLNNLLLRSLAVGAGALLAFFLISLFFSGWALRPAEKAWQQQRRFVADASHELKTPLTVILANTGILLAHKEDTIAEQSQWIESTQEESLRMKQLIDSMLFLAKSDAVSEPMMNSTFNFSEILLSTVLAFESLAFEKGVALVSDDVAAGIYIHGDAAQLKQLSGILLDNACKYSGPGGTVTVKLGCDGDELYLSVNNNGDVISAEDIPHLFERFYRGDKARVNTSDSFGLGLSIAETIVEKHRGKISVKSNAEEGTTFTVRLRAE